MKDDRLYLEHILEATRKIRAYSAGGREDFMRNTMVQDAILRNFEVIGEAAKQLSEQARAKRPDVPWSDVARFRDILIHHYMGVDLKRVWNVIASNLAVLHDAVEEMLAS